MAVTAAALSIKISANISDFEKQLKGVESAWKRTGSKLQSVGRELTTGITLPLVAFGAAASKAAIDFESSFAGIRKTVKASDEQFSQLATGMREMAKVKPIDVNELNRIGEIGGQMGIAADGILEFTSVIADMGATTSLSTEEAAAGLGKLAAITGTPIEDFRKLGDAIGYLGDSGNSTEQDILNFGLRIAGAGRLAGLTVQQTLGIAAAFSDVGIEAEAGGTAVQQVLQTMLEASATGNANLAKFEQLVPNFGQLFKSNPAQAFTEFVNALGASGTQAFSILSGLGLNSERLARSFITVSQAGTLMGDSIQRGVFGFSSSNKLAQEAEIRYKTVASQLQILKNKLTDVFISVGQQLVPALLKMVPAVESTLKSFASLVQVFAELPRGVQTFALGLAGLAAAAGPVSYLVGQVKLLGSALIGLGRTSGVVDAIGRSIGAASQAGASAGISGIGGLAAFSNISKGGFLDETVAARMAAFGNVTVPQTTANVTVLGGVMGTLAQKFGALTAPLGALALANPVGFFIGLGVAVSSLATSWTSALATMAAAPIGGLLDSWARIKAGWNHYFGDIENPDVKGDRPTGVFSVPLGPAAGLSEAQKATSDFMRGGGFKALSGGGAGGGSGHDAFSGFSKGWQEAGLKAREYMADLSKVGGLTHLTSDQTADLSRVLLDAIEKYRVLGKVAPQAWSDTLLAMADYRNVLPAIHNANDELAKMATLSTAALTALPSNLGILGMDKTGAPSGFSLREIAMNAAMGGAPAVESGGNIAAKIKENAAATTTWKDSLKQLSSSFSDLAQVAGGSLSSIARTMGTVISAVNVGAEGFGNLKGGFGQFKDALGGKGGFMGALGGIGGMISGVMGMISSAIQLGKSLAHAFGWKSRSEKAVSGFNKDFGASSVSEDFAKSILDQAKAQFGGNIDAAKIMNLGGFIEQAGGLNAGNIGQMSARLHDVFSMIETGAVSAAQGAQVLDETFQQFADYALKQGPLVSQQLIDIIHLNDQFGTHSQAVSEFVKGQAGSAVSGLQTFVNSGTTTPITAQGAQGLGAAAGAIFGGLLNENVPATEILAQLGPIVTQLDAMFKKAGVDGGAAFGEVLRLSQLLSSEIAGPGIQAVSGLNQVLQGLHNSGLMTQEIFAGVSNQVAATFNDLVAKGSNASDVLKLMQPSLQTIWELQKQFGYSVDAATQSLLNQAVAAGVVGAAHQSIEQQSLDIQKQQLDVLNAIAGVFGVAIPTAMTATGAATDALSQKFAKLAGIAGSVGPAVGSTGIRVAAPSGGTLPGTLPRASAPTTGTVTPTPTPTVTNREGALTVNIQSVYGSVDANFAQSLARTISLGGTTKTAWQGALK